MGVGKTSIGKLLAKDLQLQFYDADHEIEKRTGASITWIFDLEGEQGFRQRETRMIDELTREQGIVLATGGGAVMNPGNRKALHDRGVVIYLKAKLEDLTERTSRNQNRPLLAKDGRAVLERLLAQREPLYCEIADLIYDTSGKSVVEITSEIMRDLREKNFF